MAEKFLVFSFFVQPGTQRNVLAFCQLTTQILRPDFDACLNLHIETSDRCYNTRVLPVKSRKLSHIWTVFFLIESFIYISNVRCDIEQCSTWYMLHVICYHESTDLHVYTVQYIQFIIRFYYLGNLRVWDTVPRSVLYVCPRLYAAWNVYSTILTLEKDIFYL